MQQKEDLGFNNRKYIIIPVTEVNKIDFSEILETSIETMSKSVDGSKTFLKWDAIKKPDFIDTLVNFEGIYNNAQIIEILSSEEWN